MARGGRPVSSATSWMRRSRGATSVMASILPNLAVDVKVRVLHGDCVSCEPMAVDPDSRARTHLANERTFLAWFRSGITLVALGLAAAQFLGSTGGPGELVVHLLATLVIGTGGLMAVVGLARYRVNRREID